jgi:hypothetical protein
MNDLQVEDLHVHIYQNREREESIKNWLTGYLSICHRLNISLLEISPAKGMDWPPYTIHRFTQNFKKKYQRNPWNRASQKASPRTWLLLPAVASFGAAAEEAGRVSYQWEEAALGTATSTASVRYSRQPRRNRRRRHLGFRGAATNRQEEAAHRDPPPRPPARPTSAAPWPGTATSGPHGAGRCTACRERRRSARVGGGGRRERERGSDEAACTGGGEIFLRRVGKENQELGIYLFS